MFLIDSHAHLDMAQFDEDRDAVVGRAVAAGVRRILSVGIDVASSRAAVELAERFHAVYAAVGIHPHEASGADEQALVEIEKLAGRPKVVAIGEIGLDFFKNYSPQPDQERAFAAQLALAAKLGLPAIVHDRDAHRRVLELLDAQPCQHGVIHCFSGGPELAAEVLQRGLYVSFTGNITFDNAKRARAALAAAGTERLLLETDCPFMTPVPLRKQRCEPQHVTLVAAKAAEVLGLPLHELAARTSNNAFDLFGFERRGLAQRIVYELKGALYLNITNRCGNRCPWCARQSSYAIGPYLLRLQSEPSLEQIAQALEQFDPAAYSEVVFCGFGEPLMRVDDVAALALELKRRGARRVRVNTNGWAGLALGRDVLGPLVGRVDAVSVSLNAPTADSYVALCNPCRSKEAYADLLDFVKRARQLLPEVALTAVDYPGADIADSRELAARLGLPLRVRDYTERP